MAYNEATVLSKISKNSRGEEFWISSVPEKDGGNSVDVRLYYTNDKNEMAPTKKGIRVSSELMPEVMLAMFDAMDESAKADFVSDIMSRVDDTNIDDCDGLEEDD